MCHITLHTLTDSLQVLCTVPCIIVLKSCSYIDITRVHYQRYIVKDSCSFITISFTISFITIYTNM